MTEFVHRSSGTVLGRKDDGVAGSGEMKDRWDLVPTRAMRQVVRVLSYGAKKYAAWNWLHVPEPRDRYYAAALRHLTAWRDGEALDPDTGLSHLAHASCCILFLLGFEAGDAAYKTVESK